MCLVAAVLISRVGSVDRVSAFAGMAAPLYRDGPSLRALTYARRMICGMVGIRSVRRAHKEGFRHVYARGRDRLLG